MIKKILSSLGIKEFISPENKLHFRVHCKSVSDSTTKCNRALKLCGQHWPQSKGTGTPWASTHHLPPVSLHLLFHEPLSISCSQMSSQLVRASPTTLTAAPITSWAGTSSKSVHSLLDPCSGFTWQCFGSRGAAGRGFREKKSRSCPQQAEPVSARCLQS